METVVKNTHSLADRAAIISLIGAQFLSLFTASFESSKVDGLKATTVQFTCLGAVEGQPHKNEHVSQALHSKTNGSVPHVGSLSLENVNLLINITLLIKQISFLIPIIPTMLHVNNQEI
jgi:hypothetical protein